MRCPIKCTCQKLADPSLCFSCLPFLSIPFSLDASHAHSAYRIPRLPCISTQSSSPTSPFLPLVSNSSRFDHELEYPCRVNFIYIYIYMALVARLCMRSSTRMSPLLQGALLYNAYARMGNTNTAGVKGSLPSLMESTRCIVCDNTPSSLKYYSTDHSDPAGSSDDHRAGDISVKLSNTPTRHDGEGRGRSRRSLLWSSPWDLVPFVRSNGGGFGNALEHMSGSLNRLFQNLMPSRILGRMTEDDRLYKLQYEVPGFSKEDLKITIDKGFLTISGEHKEEEGGESDHHDDEDGDGYWHGSRYRFYHTSLMLPADAKVDDIKAELKHGILHITIPRAEDQKSDAKTVHIY